MKKVIKDFNIEEKEEEIKKWYDGYKIGNVGGIYNPWSILNYLTRKEIMPYWVNTSSNDLIKMTIKNSITVKEKIEKLLRDEPIEETINLETIIVGIEEKEENIWGAKTTKSRNKRVIQRNSKRLVQKQSTRK